ncbi:MAG TPA: c-type cytochrome [Longimicrobiales bacterium]
MRRPLRVAAIILASLAGVLLLVVGGVYGMSGAQMRRTWPLPPPTVFDVPSDSVSIERGRHLVRAVLNCAECHGDDLGGEEVDAGPIGVMSTPNLTVGNGGLAAGFAVGDWVRALRYGVRRDGTSLLIMPSETYTYLTDADLAAVIAYLRHAPPVDRQLPPTRLRLLGRALLAAGRLPLLVAPKTATDVPRSPVPPGVTVEYGRYLANVSGCRGCHGLNLSGGFVAGPPGTPEASNLTPVGIESWTEEDFFRALRQGVRPDGSAIDEFMPWRYLAGMTDDELRAILMYLRTVPPLATGNR